MFMVRTTVRLGGAARRRWPAAHQLQLLGRQAVHSSRLEACCRGAAKGALTHLAILPSDPTDQPRPPVCLFPSVP